MSKRATTFMLTQYLNPDYFNWSDQEKTYFNAGDIQSESENVMGNITNRVFHERNKLEVAGICHDEDTNVQYDASTGKEVIVKKLPHIHMFIHVDSRVSIDQLAGWVGVEPQYIEAAKKGRYGTENILAYLIHAKDGNKHQYSPSAVKTYGTMDYMTYYVSHKQDWDNRRATVSKKQSNIQADWLAEQAREGKLTKQEIILNDEYAQVYANNMQLINDSLQFYGERRGYKSMQALENQAYELSVIYVTGAPGSGKSYFSKELCRQIIERELKTLGERWSIYNCAETNPFDDYNGEEVLYMDDLRATALDASAWLRLLDPLSVNTAGARYHNKILSPRVIIINSYIPPMEFFGFMKGAALNEALDQFIRRLSMIAKVIDLGPSYRPRHRFDLHRVVKLPDTEEIKIGSKDLGKVSKKVNFNSQLVYQNQDEDQSLKCIVDYVDTNNSREFKHVLSSKYEVSYNDRNVGIGLDD